MKNIKVILHDWDDTIVDSYKTYENWYFDFASEYKLEKPEFTVLRKHWGKPPAHLLAEIWPHLTVEKAREMVSNFVPPKKYVPQAHKGVKEALLKLKESGYILGILTSGYAKQTMKGYKGMFGPNLFIHDVVYSEKDSEYYKPDPRVFDKPVKDLCDKYTIGNEEILYVGDSLYDMQAAHAKGLLFVGVLTGITNKEMFVNAGLKEQDIISSFSDIFDYLRSSEQK